MPNNNNNQYANQIKQAETNKDQASGQFGNNGKQNVSN